MHIEMVTRLKSYITPFDQAQEGILLANCTNRHRFFIKT